MFWSSHERRKRSAARRWRDINPRFLSAAIPAIIPAIIMVTGTAAVAQPVPRLEVDLRALASPNPLLLPGPDREAILIETTARPGIRIETPAGSSFDLGGVITNRRYSRRYGNFVIGRVDATVDYRDSEFLTVEGQAGLSRDVAIDLLTSSVESAVDPTSIRTGYAGRVSVTWRPDEYTWVQPEISADRFSYDRTGLLGDTRAINANLALRRRTGPRTTLGLRTGAIFSDTARLSSTDTQFFYATVDRRLSAGWRLVGEAGAERTGARTESLLGQNRSQSARTRLGGRAELCRMAPGPAVCLAGALNSEVSGLGGLQRRAIVTASIDQRLDERTTARLNAEYQRTVMQGGFFPSFDAVRVVGTVEHTVRQDWRIGATLQYLRRRLVDGSRIGAAFAGLHVTFVPNLR